MPPAKSPPRPAIPEEVAIVPVVPDALTLEIRQCEQAIIETKESKDPAYIAAPWKRGRLLEELEDRIAHLKRLQAQEAAAAQERARKAELQAAWDALAPEREALALRWEKAKAEARAVIAEAERLNRLHIGTADRPMLSEPIAPITFLNAVLVPHERHLIVRPDSF